MKRWIGSAIRKFSGVADELVPEFDNQVKFFVWISGAFTTGLFAGAAFSQLLVFLGVGGTDHVGVRSSENMVVEKCADVSQLAHIQSEYSSQIEPLMTRLIELTKELEKADLMPSEYERKRESQGLLQGEIERIQNQQSKDFKSVAEACNSK